MPKVYEELCFTDDFMFCKVLTNNLDLTRKLLEIILGIEIDKVELSEAQKVIDHRADAKGIRLDVYVKDASGTVFDLEMQTTGLKNLGKRTRYYQGMIDLDLINKGELYNMLKRTYIVFVCTGDPFKQGLPLYTFENRCREDLSVKLGDESTKVFVNPDGDRRTATKQLVALLDYIKNGKAKDPFTMELDGAVKKARTHEEWRVEYMTLLMRDAEKLAEGEDRGFFLYQKLQRYVTSHPDEPAEEIAKIFQCSIARVDAVQEDLATRGKVS